jgi:hypothetical protein
MGGIRSGLFGDIQYQTSEPVQNPNDKYYYQRSRQVDREGKVVGTGEEIFRSAQPESKDGLLDPNRGFEHAYALGTHLADLSKVIFGLVGENPILTTRAVSTAVKHASSGVPYPFDVGYQSWPGTSEPWDSNTLNSDRNPQFQPGKVERFFNGSLPENGIRRNSHRDGDGSGPIDGGSERGARSVSNTTGRQPEALGWAGDATSTSGGGQGAGGYAGLLDLASSQPPLSPNSRLPFSFGGPPSGSVVRPQAMSDALTFGDLSSPGAHDFGGGPENGLRMGFRGRPDDMPINGAAMTGANYRDQLIDPSSAPSLPFGNQLAGPPSWLPRSPLALVPAGAWQWLSAQDER